MKDRGGSIELEQIGSTNPPLGVHCLYAGRHRQPRGRQYRQVCQLGGPAGRTPTDLSPVQRSVLVRAALRSQVAQRLTHFLPPTGKKLSTR